MSTDRGTAPSTPNPVHATVTVPGSKSQTNRALVLAALATRARAPSTISGALRSRDTDLMIGALRALGVARRRRRLRADGQRRASPRSPARAWTAAWPAPCCASCRRWRR